MTGRDVVGRDEELATIGRFLADNEHGVTVLLLQGEAGVGKTTLWEAGVAIAEGRAMRVLRCNPSASEARLSFAALTDLIDDALDEILPVLAAPRARALEVALLRRVNSRADPHGVALGVLDGLRVLSADRPLLVAVDDWQWLDQPTGAALTFAMRRLGTGSVRVLCSARPANGGPSAGPDVPVAAVERVELQPLEPNALHALLRDRLSLALSRPTLMRVHIASGGNPFFALQIARALADSPAPLPVGGPLPVPADLRTLLRARVEEHDEEVKEVLRIAAVLSTPSISSIEQVSGDADRARAAGARAAEAGLLRFDGDEVRFEHPLIASAVMAATTPDALRALHAAAAEVARGPEERARHLALASAGPDREVAAALDGAVEQATARGAYAAAAELSDLAVRATPESERADRVRRVLTCADRWRGAGDGGRAVELLDGLVGALPAGPPRAAALNRLAALVDYDSSRNLALAEQALREARGDEPLQAWIHCNLAEILATRGEMSAFERHARQAAELARRAGQDGLLADALAMLGPALSAAGLGPQRELCAEALAAAARAETSLPEDPERSFGALLCDAGDIEEAQPLVTRALQKALGSGDTASECRALCTMAELEYLAGRLSSADRYSADALALAEQIQVENFESFVLQRRALVEAQLGRIEQAREHARRGAELSRAGDRYVYLLHQANLGFIALSAGEPKEAVTHLQPLPDEIRRTAPRDPNLFTARALAAEALVATGEHGRGAEIVTELEEAAACADHAWGLGLASRSRALIAAADGELEEATTAAQRAIAWHETVAIPFELARTLLVYGVIQRRAKRKRPARDTLGRAAAIFEDLGAALWIERTHTEVGRIGGRRPTASSGVLSATEEGVAQLAAAGRTNKQIAAELFLSERTVEANLTKVYRKLGLRSRAQLASRWPRNTS